MATGVLIAVKWERAVKKLADVVVFGFSCSKLRRGKLDGGISSEPRQQFRWRKVERLTFA